MSEPWTSTALGALLQQRKTDVAVEPSETYQFAGVYSFGRGLFRGQERSGSQFSYSVLTRLRAGDFVYPKLMAWEGAFGVVPPECDGCVVSPEFPVFDVDRARVHPRFLELYFRIPAVWERVSGGSTGTNARRRRLHPTDFLRSRVPLPPLGVQQALVARFEQLASRVEQARAIRTETDGELNALLLGAHRRASVGAPLVPLGDLAPLVRRPVSVETDKEYPQISVRSFGRGTFHKGPLAGNEITWEKPFRVEEGDILISNIKAWEGAVAVASKADHGRFASHRYLTCVPKPGLATARFVCFYLLSAEGLHRLGEASPGSADRNRTLGARALQEIPVPAPPFEQQRWFDRIYAEADAARQLGVDVDAECDAMLPALIHREFSADPGTS